MQLTDLQTPALLIRLDRVRQNLQCMAADTGGDIARWRPHIKTTKIPAIYRMMLGAGVRHFKCATTREARVLLECADEPIDLLIAFPHRSANLARIAELAAAFSGHSLSLLSEDADHAREVRASSPALGIFIDLDPGYHRTGIPLSDRDRIEQTLAAAAAATRGLHYYDGHLHDGGPADRQEQCAKIYGEFLATVDALGLGDLELITSGTPTFRNALAFPQFAKYCHRVSPGTVVYSDLRTEEVGVDGFVRAAQVLARVVSAPSPDSVTCDAGSKAIDAAAGDPCAAVEGWPGLLAQTPSEEHLPLRVDTGSAPPPGTLIELTPRHVCPTVNLFDEAVLLDGDTIVDVVPVAARGHETR